MYMNSIGAHHAAAARDIMWDCIYALIACLLLPPVSYCIFCLQHLPPMPLTLPTVSAVVSHQASVPPASEVLNQLITPHTAPLFLLLYHTGQLFLLFFRY